MALELHSCTLGDIQVANFPLNHDCILKVYLKPNVGLRFQYFSCRAQDSGSLSLIISQLIFVNKVVCIPVDNF